MNIDTRPARLDVINEKTAEVSTLPRDQYWPQELKDTSRGQLKDREPANLLQKTSTEVTTESLKVCDSLPSSLSRGRLLKGPSNALEL